MADARIVLPGEAEPTTLPLLPLRGAVLFPGTVLPVVLGDPAAAALVDDAAADRRLAVVALREPAPQSGEAAAFYDLGVEALLVRFVRHPGGRLQLLLQGVRRLRVALLVQTEPYLRARMLPVEETPAPAGRETEARVLNLQRLFQEAAELAPYLSPEAVLAALNAPDPGALADFIAASLPLPVAEKQAILETLEVAARLDRVGAALARELETLRVSRKIREDVERRIERGHRERILREQLQAIQRELGEEAPEIAELRRRLAAAELPDEVRTVAQRELDRLAAMSPYALEAGIVRTYLEWLLELPWRRASPERLDLAEVRRTLDADHHGLARVKRRILEHLAVRRLKPEARGAILCFVGPPGVGKTSLGQSIARATGRPFARLSLGGVSDEAEIRGHRRTYVGALPGRILQALRRAGANNPVLMLDEVDKLGHGVRGDPAAALLEALDPEQNAQFLDHYLDLPFDLSRVFFICTANDTEPIPPPLLDRMETLELPGYTEEEKLAIARGFLIPRELDAHGLSPGQLAFTEDALRTMIGAYTAEAGVRQLRRQVAAVCRAVALRVAQGQAEPVTVTGDQLEEYLGPPRYFPEVAERTARSGVATGLAWTPTGGDVLFIEATRMPGKGNLILTGHLGEVMKESAQIALSLVRAQAEVLGIAPGFYETIDLHVHVPEGAVAKDGPSAGMTIYIALVSLLTGRPVRPDVGLTGEITLRGSVLPVGGVREKVLAARRAGLLEVVLPRRNEPELRDLPEEAKRALVFHLVSVVDEVPALALVAEAGPVGPGGAPRRP